MSRIDVSVMFDSEAFTLSVSELMSFDVRLVVGSLGDVSLYEDEIRRAIERVFTGF